MRDERSDVMRCRASMKAGTRAYPVSVRLLAADAWDFRQRPSSTSCELQRLVSHCGP